MLNQVKERKIPRIRIRILYRNLLLFIVDVKDERLTKIPMSPNSTTRDHTFLLFFLSFQMKPFRSNCTQIKPEKCCLNPFFLTFHSAPLY